MSPGERVPLPRPSIDTGMGLERIAAVLQGKHDNYDIDLFRALILASAEASGVAPDGPHAVSHRVIADHLRASAFLIADGVLPSKEGRGYVLRRIMRRAMRHAHMLGCKEPLMWRLVPALVQQMGAAYPELLRAQPLITETLRLEETNFKQTLERGLRLLEEETARLGPGEALLRRDRLPALRHLRLSARPDRGRAARTGPQGGGRRASRRQWRASARRRAGAGSARARRRPRRSGSRLREELGATEFLGYETESAEGVVLAIMRDGARVAEADRRRRGRGRSSTRRRSMPSRAARWATPAVIFSAGGAELAVRDTVKKAGDLHVHLGTLTHGVLKDGDAVELRVDGRAAGGCAPTIR